MTTRMMYIKKELECYTAILSANDGVSTNQFSLSTIVMLAVMRKGANAERTI